MQNITLTIEGNYWDSFIYKGILYLFNFNNGIKVCNWDEICEYIITQTNCNLGVYYGLQHGNKLYNNDISDSELEQIKNEFDLLSSQDIYISNSELQKFIVNEADSPFKDISNDIELFNDILYCASDYGLESFQLISNELNPIVDTMKSDIIWDNPIINIRASISGRMTLSSGERGLYEYTLGNYFFSDRENSRINTISKKHSSYADWNFSSVYNSSDEGQSFLSVYQRIQKEFIQFYNFKNFEQIESRDAKFLNFKRDVSQQEIFSVDKSHLSWGYDNKMYCWNGNALLINDFKQYEVNKDGDAWFGKARAIELGISTREEVIRGGVSFFGVIVELENRLLVISHGQENAISYLHISEPLTKWRVFLRSQRYENQMHVIFDDCMKIYAFTDDYFSRKQKKDLGIRYNSR